MPEIPLKPRDPITTMVDSLDISSSMSIAEPSATAWPMCRSGATSSATSRARSTVCKVSRCSSSKTSCGGTMPSAYRNCGIEYAAARRSGMLRFIAVFAAQRTALSEAGLPSTATTTISSWVIYKPSLRSAGYNPSLLLSGVLARQFLRRRRRGVRGEQHLVNHTQNIHDGLTDTLGEKCRQRFNQRP